MDAAQPDLGEESRSLRILAVDDTPANLALLRAALSKAGHMTITASRGEEALQLFSAERPDLVLMDVMMPGMDGIETTRRIRAMDVERWVPIIFISALGHSNDMVRGLEAGGDDYLTKPIDLVLLLAKISAMQRIAGLESRLHKANKVLNTYRQVSEYELNMARELLERMVVKYSSPVEGVDLWTQAAAKLGGDLVVTQRHHNDRSYVLLADAMGHGLSATLPLLPLVEVFSSMTRDGFTIAAIVREINTRLYTLLPTGNFVTVTLLSVDWTNRILEIWNGGNPAALLLDAEGKVVRSFSSRNPALGILSEDDFDAVPESLQWHAKGALLLYSDGLVDALDAQGVDFGESRIIDALRGDDPHQSLKQAILAHLGEQSANDDISFATVALR